MKEYDYKAIPYKERLTTLCGIALNQYNVIHIDIQQFVSKYPVIKNMVARLTKELLFDVKMEMPDVTLFDETDLVRTSKDIFSQKREKFIFIIDEWDSIFRVHRDNCSKGISGFSAGSSERAALCGTCLYDRHSPNQEIRSTFCTEYVQGISYDQSICTRKIHWFYREGSSSAL